MIGNNFGSHEKANWKITEYNFGILSSVVSNYVQIIPSRLAVLST